MIETLHKNKAPKLIEFHEKYGTYWFVHAVALAILKKHSVLHDAFFDMHGLAYTDSERDEITPFISDNASEMVIDRAFGVSNDVSCAADIFDLASAFVLRYYFFEKDSFYVE